MVDMSKALEISNIVNNAMRHTRKSGAVVLLYSSRPAETKFFARLLSIQEFDVVIIRSPADITQKFSSSPQARCLIILGDRAQADLRKLREICPELLEVGTVIFGDEHSEMTSESQLISTRKVEIVPPAVANDHGVPAD